MTTTSMTPPQAVNTAKKLILPLVVIVAAAVLAMVMGVPWTSAGEASSGIHLAADKNQGATLTITKLEPGQSASRTVTIRNSGAQESRLSFAESADPTTFADGDLQLKIVHDGQTVYDGQFGAMNDVTQDVGTLPPGGSSQFTFTVSLPDNAPFADQGEPAKATYTWVNSDSGVG